MLDFGKSGPDRKFLDQKFSEIFSFWQNRSKNVKKWPNFGHFLVKKSDQKTEVSKNREKNTIINLLILITPGYRHFYFLHFFAFFNLINENGPKIGQFWVPGCPKSAKNGRFLGVFGKSGFLTGFGQVRSRTEKFMGCFPIFEKNFQFFSKWKKPKKVEKWRKNTFFLCFFVKNTKKTHFLTFLTKINTFCKNADRTV